MKKFLTILIAVGLLSPVISSAQVFSQNQLIIQPFGGYGVVMSTTTANGGKLMASSTPYFPQYIFGNATGTSATTTNLSVTNLSGTNINGYSLSTCNSASSAITWASGTFGCHTISAGSGGGSGTWATTTSTVTNNLINYPLNTTDIPCVGGQATTTCKFFFDPNTSLASILGTASSTNFLAFGSSTLQKFTFTNATGTNATTTNFFSTTASTSNLFAANIQGAGLGTCNGSTSGLSWAAGLFGCVTITPAASSITGGAALTKTDDTNVTLTLGGSPSTSLLAATSLTLGWTGTLADSRVADNLTISGGTVDNTPIGNTTKSTGQFTTILASSSTTLQNFTGLQSTTTNSTSTNFFATTASSTNIYTNIGNALVLSGTDGKLGAYAGVTCTNQFLRALSLTGASTCATVGAADVSLANLTATDATLTFSGTYNGATARTIGINLGNANTWSALQTFSNANSILANGSTTLQNFTGLNSTTTNSTSTSFAISNIASGNCLQTSTGGAIISSGSACGAGISGGATNALTYWTSSSALSNISNTNVASGGVFMGIGTTTPQWLLQLASSTRSQLTLSDATAGDDHLSFRWSSPNLWIASSSNSTYATSSTAALNLNTNSPSSISVGTGNYTSTMTIGTDYLPAPIASSTSLLSVGVAGSTTQALLVDSPTNNGAVSVGTSFAVASGTPTFPSKNGLVTLGTNGSNGSTTISMGKLQWDGYSNTGARTCMYVVGTSLVVQAGACTQ